MTALPFPALLALALAARGPATTDIDPNLYVNSLDTLVTYDDLLNGRDYDDGWTPDAWRPFEAELAAHGTWQDTDALGRVWFPSASETGPGFVPYGTHGRWVLTEYGWTWRSGWSWGWATFHYGRWVVMPGRGWCWIPGTLWSPAWVAWRLGRDYVAWAPLPPDGVSIGRPLGPRSPWTMTTVRAFGVGASVPKRVVPALFGHTNPFSNLRRLDLGAYEVRVNAGPTRMRCASGHVAPAERLADAAPEAAPRDAIRPASVAPPQPRPWVTHHFVAQTPLCRWPTRGGDTGPC
jgi:hypothetical protein